MRCGLGTAANLRLHLARDASTPPTAYRNAFRSNSVSATAPTIKAYFYDPIGVS